MGGGAWPFLVGGVICLVNSVNERDLSLLTSRVIHMVWVSVSFGGWPWIGSTCFDFLEGQLACLIKGSLRQ